jgi:hypothetical protein
VRRNPHPRLHSTEFENASEQITLQFKAWLILAEGL